MDGGDGTPRAAMDASEKEEEEEVDMVGPLPVAPRPKRKLGFERAYLDALPSAQMYEKSYMHRDIVTHVAVSSAEFFITGSCDGHIKFWKKKGVGVEFVKHFRSHLGPIENLSVSADGLLCCTTSSDRAAKIYDVVNYDMMAMLRLPYSPGAAEWVFKLGDAVAKLAISDRKSPNVHIYDARSGSNEPIFSKQIHMQPVKAMRYNPIYDIVLSTDTKGLLEYWSPDSLLFPDHSVQFKFKTETDLYSLAKAKTTVSALEVTVDGKQFVTTSPDRRIRVFWFLTGRLRRTYDESLEVAQDLQRSDSPMYKLDAIDFGRRMAVEREIEKTEDVPEPNAIFDESGNFLIYTTLLGIKVVNLHSNKVVRIIGKVENTERFLRVALFQGASSSKRVKKIPTAVANVNDKKEPLTDPTLLCCAFKKHRFYLFSRREPEEAEDTTKGRDVFNERPPAEELLAIADVSKTSSTSLPENVVMHTTLGDIHMRLYPEECPRTVENFTTHCRNGYYDNLIFHRVIKGFMVQTGDPLGDGTGGQSIWGGEFEDEFHKSLRHDRPFTLSMANAGPNTNGSQFFITTVATPWLDNKHTVFGRVVKGMDVVQAIEKIKVDKNSMPYQDIKILSVTIPKI
ncbi:unnamed protein product [Calypogeia fissa]